MRNTVRFAASALVIFLVTIGPLETAAIFGVLTAGVRRSARLRLATQAVAIGGGGLVVFAIGGTKFLRLLQVSMPAFEIDGTAGFPSSSGNAVCAPAVTLGATCGPSPPTRL